MGDGCRKKVRTLKIKKMDDKPMVIHTKEKAKIHSHEPKGARIKGSNIYTVGQTVVNAFRTFADKPEVDYSQKEQKHLVTKVTLSPMKAMGKLFVSMELHLDASIDKLDNLAMDVQLDKDKRAERDNAKAQEESAKEDIEKIETIENKPERVEAEIVCAPMVAETHEYQYNADAFEARGSADVKVEAPKEVPMVRTEKAR